MSDSKRVDPRTPILEALRCHHIPNLKAELLMHDDEPTPSDWDVFVKIVMAFLGSCTDPFKLPGRNGTRDAFDRVVEALRRSEVELPVLNDDGGDHEDEDLGRSS